MKSITGALFFSLSILGLCCTDPPETYKPDKIYRIVFATGGCRADCPKQVFSIDSSFMIRYHGVEFTQLKGYYYGEISASFWDTLNEVFDSLRYVQLDTSYGFSSDGLSTELFIYYKNEIKHIQGQFSALPENVMNICDWLMNEKDKIPLWRTDEDFVFETIIDKPLPAIIKSGRCVPMIIDND